MRDVSVFVSYSRKDKTTAFILIRQLQNEFGEHNVWYDGRLFGGDPWWQVILQEIRRRTVFVILVTNQSKESVYCNAELKEARRLRKPIVPVAIYEITPPKYIENLHYVRLYEDETDADATLLLEQFVNSIKFRHTQRRKWAVPRYPVQTPNPLPTDTELRTRFINRFNSFVAASVLLLALVAILGFGLSPESIMGTVGTVQVERNATVSPPDAYSPVKPPTATLPPTTTPFVPPTPGPIVAARPILRKNIPQPGHMAVSTDWLLRARIGVETNDEWEPYIISNDGIIMVLVPEGCFTMGGFLGRPDVVGFKEICFDAPFWIDRYEVTNQVYGGHALGCAVYSSHPNEPRICITWHDAQAHCESRGGSLPTEAEWEYAARGPDNLEFPWGNDFQGDIVVHADTNIDRPRGPVQVGTRIRGASWVGAFDMAGNVWEFTRTIVDETRFQYPYEANDGRNDITLQDVWRSARGGSYHSSEDNLRTYQRKAIFNTDASLSVGFRCVIPYHE